MSVKEHYDHHLGNFYSWMMGDFEEKKEDFLHFCKENNVSPLGSGNAIDLGAGNGIQSVTLADLGFNVRAIDFNKQLLYELEGRKAEKTIKIINDDIKNVLDYKNFKPELIICCGDTISHLEVFEEIEKLIKNCYDVLDSKGKIILSFRDYSDELKDTSRFIPVKGDNEKILTCFLEYLPDKVRVTDLLHVKGKNVWQQKVSSYFKVRISRNIILNYLNDAGFNLIFESVVNRMIVFIGQKI